MMDSGSVLGLNSKAFQGTAYLRPVCPKCRTPIPEAALNSGQLTPCACDSLLQITLFPAFFKERPHTVAAEVALVEGEATCFYHPVKKAVLPCQGCGRFLCSLCDCELHGQHFCPACLETGRTKGKIKNLENQRTLYDSIALTLATAPLIIFWITFITAPAALFVAIRYWRAPLSLVRRTRIRYLVAIAFSGIQLVGWVMVFYVVAQAIYGTYGR